jgi:hypothetical protein
MRKSIVRLIAKLPSDLQVLVISGDESLAEIYRAQGAAILRIDRSDTKAKRYRASSNHLEAANKIYSPSSPHVQQEWPRLSSLTAAVATREDIQWTSRHTIVEFDEADPT